MYLAIYSKDTNNLLGSIKTYNYVQYIKEYCSRGSFSITVPVDEESLQYAVFGNYIYFELGVWGVIKEVKDVETSDYEVNISGYLANHFLEYRSFLLTTKYYDTPGVIARTMVNDLFINPTDSKRKIPMVKLSTDSSYQGNSVKGKINFQSTGKTVMSALQKLLDQYDMGFELYPAGHMSGGSEGYSNIFDTLEFRIITPKNRTIDNTEDNNPVVFSFDLDNVSQIEYDDDGKDYCSVAVVAAEGRGEDRKVIEVGDTESSGVDRIELYVDARDLQEGEEEDLSGAVEQLEEDVSDLDTSVTTLKGNLNGYSFGYTTDGKPGYKTPDSDEYVAFKSGGGGYEVVEYERLMIPKVIVVDAVTTFTSIVVASGYASKSVTKG